MSQERPTNLALISIEREFLLVDAKNKVAQTFSHRRAHLGKRNYNSKRKFATELLVCSKVVE